MRQNLPPTAEEGRQGMDEWRQVQNCALEEGRRQVLKMAKSAVASRMARARAWQRVVGQTGSVGPLISQQRYPFLLQNTSSVGHFMSKTYMLL